MVLLAFFALLAGASPIFFYVFISVDIARTTEILLYRLIQNVFLFPAGGTSLRVMMVLNDLLRHLLAVVFNERVMVLVVRRLLLDIRLVWTEIRSQDLSILGMHA